MKTKTHLCIIIKDAPVSYKIKKTALSCEVKSKLICMKMKGSPTKMLLNITKFFNVEIVLKCKKMSLMK